MADEKIQELVKELRVVESAVSRLKTENYSVSH